MPRSPRTAGPPDPTRLARLLVASAGADHAAFAELYDATSSRTHGVALRVLRDPAQAEEVVQEAYLDAWRHATRFDPARGSALAWLLTLVHRRAVDRARSVDAARRRDATDHRLGERLADAETEPTYGNPAALRGALAALSAVQREAIELAYFDGLTHVEVGRRLGIPLGTAKTRIRDGLIRLRGQLVPTAVVEPLTPRIV